jgi:hypothetical protein
MTYTLWHSGIKIGDTDFAHRNPTPDPRQRAGIFQATSYGERIFPKLKGALTACAGIKEHVVNRGLDPERLSSDDVDEALESSAGGQAFREIGRTLFHVEIRDPQGRTLEYTQIAFMDLDELQALSRRLGTPGPPEDLPPDAPRYIVSARLKSAKDWRPPAVPALRSRD